MRMKKGNTFVLVLEWICIFAIVLAMVSTIWAAIVYKERNGSFLPKMDSTKGSVSKNAEVLSVAKTPLPNANNLEMDPNASLATSAPLQIQEEEKGICVAGFKTLKIAANQKDVTVDFENPIENEGRFLMTFELLLPTVGESYESVYSSGLVDAGQHIRNISLLHPITAGTYEDCILRIQPYFTSDRSPANTAEVSFTLFAE